jgi:hypothetical protein
MNDCSQRTLALGGFINFKLCGWWLGLHGFVPFILLFKSSSSKDSSKDERKDEREQRSEQLELFPKIFTYNSSIIFKIVPAQSTLVVGLVNSR